MSHADGYVKFKSGEIKFFIYHATCDLCNTKLFDSREKGWEAWLSHEYLMEDCTCGNAPEEAEVFVYYADDATWKILACEKCNVLVDRLCPFESNAIWGKTPDWIKKMDEENKKNESP